MNQFPENPISPISFSEIQVKELSNLVQKIGEVMSWDLASMCSTSEELEIVREAKNAMDSIAALFHIVLATPFQDPSPIQFES